MMVLDNVKLHWPDAREWMWNYCVYLGPYTYESKEYDLGAYVNPDGSLSAAIVYGNTDGDYMSGTLRHPSGLNGSRVAHIYQIAYYRANRLGLI